MATPEAKALYKLRCVLLLFALAHNLMRTLAVAPQLLGLGPTPSARTAGTVSRAKDEAKP